jgi:putative transposase
MKFEKDKYYHLYNRSNNEEPVFRTEENYLYFFQKYISYLSELVSTVAYCLMPTHFHFIIKVTSSDEKKLQDSIGLLLSSYTKAINKRFTRHGALFQPHTKAKEITDEKYLLTLISYVHQNPLRAKKVERLEDWQYSSYLDIAGMRSGKIPDKEFYKQYFTNANDFVKYSKEIVEGVKKEFWI